MIHPWIFGYFCAAIVYGMVMNFLALRLPVPVDVATRDMPLYRNALFFFSIMLGTLWPLAGSLELYFAYKRHKKGNL